MMTETKADIESLINILLSPSVDRKTHHDMNSWFKAFNQQVRHFDASIDRAMLGGRHSLNVGFAFSSAYQSAIEALFESEDILLSSFCVTEDKGNHPRHIESRIIIEDGQLYVTGNKKFVSGANDSQCLYVACRDERQGDGLDAQGRPLIKMVKLLADNEGIDIQVMPALGFVPEVSHGKVSLNRAPITENQICEGDGYLSYVKAFRSYEDLYVLAAITAYRLGEAVDGRWPQAFIESHISLLLAIRSVSEMNLNKPSAHIGFSACRSKFEELIALTNSDFEKSNPTAFQDWSRDQVLLNIAKTAHQKRTEKAWEMMA